MLPAYIIDDILKRQRERDQERSSELRIDQPDLWEHIEEQAQEDREMPADPGVIIVDFTL
ncbi:MAG: hypothetical protein PHU25_04900 [Deltaproteobacteria bacterium]|nr:hypothetical protein [Deltaproteobacteria bacterium]